ncbi:MAG: CrcB family protein [Aquificaceae bacterium]
MSQVLAIALGGLIGVLARFLVVKIFFRPEFPMGTLVVNLSSALLIGLIIGVLGESMSLVQKGFLISGLMGGYSTFSSLVYEVFYMILKGKLALAIGYLLISNLLGVILVALGYYLGKALIIFISSVFYI